jgi:hypothetical protein
MKKVFNASVLAAAVALSFGAQAADLSAQASATITNEAIAAGVVVTPTPATIRVISRAELVPGDKVTLTFPKGSAFTGAVATSADFEIAYGNGTFTFTDVVWTAETTTKLATLTMKVELGNPVINNSAYDIKFKQLFTPASGDVTYAAVDGTTGDAKDTSGNNKVSLVKTIDQYSSKVDTKFDGFIQRLDRKAFVTTKGTIIAKVQASDKSADATVGLTGTVATNNVVVTAAQGFANVVSATITDGTTTITAVPACDVVVTDCVKNTVTFDATNGVGTDLDVTKAWSVAVVAPTLAGEKLPVSTFTVSHVVTYAATGTVTTNPSYKYINAADFGLFKLDASVVNVPYLPVGYDLTPNIEIANAGSSDAEIQIEGFDQNGVVYATKTLTMKAGKKAVTKVSEADIEAAFGLPANSKKKLSVTFVIDADAADITLAPYYRQNESRVNVMSDQYKK